MNGLRSRRFRRRSDARLAVVPSAGNASLLFVDDEPMLAEAFRRTFSRQGFDVTVASSPREAIELARLQPFKIVVTDLRMPGMDGLTMLGHLRRIQPDLVSVVVTGMPDVDLRRHGDVDPSILATFAKPWDDVEMLETLQRAVDLHVRKLDHTSDLPPAGLRMLVVQDDAADALLIRRWLEREVGAEVEVVSRVSDAEVALDVRPFDLVFADLSLPDARGLDAVRRMRRAAARAAIIVLSGTSDDAVARQAVRMGAQEFLVKGWFDAVQLRRAIMLAMERAAYVRELADLAHYDQLTGLANRRTLRDRYRYAQAVGRERQTQLGFLSIDLDRFKTINDTLGHDAGDALLQEIARRIKRSVRDHDTVARLGGDEFAVLLTDLDTQADATMVAERLVQAMNTPVRLAGTEVVVTVSVGVFVPEDTTTSFDDLLRTADATMYRAKRSGRNQLVQAGVITSAQSIERFTVEQELRDAVAYQRLTLAYQPQYRAEDATLIGFEALLRWTRENGTQVSPGVFVPMLEELGLIAEAGSWVISEACAELRRFRDAGHDPAVRMAVNLSGHQFERPGLVEHIQRVLRDNRLPASALELEITENVLMRDTKQTADTLTALRAVGARVAIDDFGTGYSSLAYLQRFRVNTLKIDRCFVSDMSEERSACIASAIIGLGHRLDLEVVAEGVETPEQLRHLRSQGCDSIQGFLLARPAASTLPFGVSLQRVAS